MNNSRTLYKCLLLCIASLLGFNCHARDIQVIQSAATGISFSLPEEWLVTDIKKDLLVQEDDPEWNIKSPKIFNDFDMYECLAPDTDGPEQGFVIYLFREGTLNPSELTYNGLKYLKEGTGGLLKCAKNTITRIIMEDVPDDFYGMQVEQFTLPFKKKNVLLFFWKDTAEDLADEVDAEMLRFLCSIHQE